MERPAIKGTGFVSAAADLRAAIDAGRLDRDRLEARLRPEDIEMIEAKVLPGDWYPIDTYGRVLDLLGELEGGGREYFLGRGRRAAERLLSSGIYHQLDRAKERRAEAADPSAAALLMVTVGRSLYNFGAWEVARSESRAGHVRIVLTEMAALPENARFTIHGFIEWAAERIVGRPARVKSLRPTPDRIEFEIQSE